MPTILICRNCRSRASADLAVNQQELANVGMLELKCHRCDTQTRWGLAQDFRAGERRRNDRRAGDRRTGRARTQDIMERRGSERRHGPVRKAERRG